MILYSIGGKERVSNKGELESQLNELVTLNFEFEITDLTKVC